MVTKSYGRYANMDGSKYNIIISNTQKIILKAQHKEKSSVDKLFSDQVPGQSVLDDVLGILQEISNNDDLMSNQRFEKLTRLSQMGIYVDEAHHMFGADLEKALHENGKGTSLRNTINELSKKLSKHGSKVVACYNFTGTPYVNNKILPEVIYAYGLQAAITNNFLKDTSVIGYSNVKSKEFLKAVIADFWAKYGGKEYEGLAPKMAIFGAEIAEVRDEIRPVVEEVLSELGIPLDKILVNVGDEKITKSEDIRDFNNLDIAGTAGSKKQFILLVNKGREGWNCRSLFSVALFRSPKSKVFVLQATMRCLRKITDEQLTATVYLSKENMDILDDELKKNFRTSIEELVVKKDKKRKKVPVRVKEPPRTLRMNKLHYKYSLETKHYDRGLSFGLKEIETENYDATQTLLREHYRCHPKIINFCNQKFYHGELIIMTTDHGEEDVLSVVKTVEGNHERDHYSQRQIDVIKNEIIPKYDLNPKETGIITPYRNQVKALGREITDIDAATVHKFQGKEMECIIISTVDDEISDFTDDPYLINVAVSRAKKKLMLVVTGNKQSKERNITDLIDYIEYNNFEVVESKIYSVFDYLYKQYTEARKAYLQKHKKISAYDSENLMYSLIEDILSDSKYSSLDVVCHFPLNMLIKNPEFLSEEECRYAMNPATHLDFLIYNRISKKPVLAIEVDGYEYHKKHTVQASRDLLKNRIMESYEIPLLRFMTNCSGEKEKIIEMLDKRMEQ